MTTDSHLISEAYLASRKQLKEQAPQPVAAAPQPATQQPPASQPAVAAPQAAPQAQQPAAPASKATQQQEKAVNELLKAFDLPATAAPYLLQSLLQNVPALKQQYGM